MLRLDSLLVGVLGDVMGGNDHSCGGHHRSNHQIALPTAKASEKMVVRVLKETA